jgi:hypothetical protein
MVMTLTSEQIDRAIAETKKAVDGGGWGLLVYWLTRIVDGTGPTSKELTTSPWVDKAIEIIEADKAEKAARRAM